MFLFVVSKNKRNANKTRRYVSFLETTELLQDTEQHTQAEKPESFLAFLLAFWNCHHHSRFSSWRTLKSHAHKTCSSAVASRARPWIVPRRSASGVRHNCFLSRFSVCCEDHFAQTRGSIEFGKRCASSGSACGEDSTV